MRWRKAGYFWTGNSRGKIGLNICANVLIKGMEERAARCAAGLLGEFRPEIFQALADPNRLTLLCRLAVASEARTVTELSNCCGVHISGVSRHLTTLRRAGIVSARKEGREVRYRLESRSLCATLRHYAAALEEAVRQGRRAARRTNRRKVRKQAR